MEGVVVLREYKLETEAQIKAAIKVLEVNSPPVLSEFAKWCLENYSEIAFQSVRALADLAGVNANTVVRFSKELGFSGYEDLRQSVQCTLRIKHNTYSKRAGALKIVRIQIYSRICKKAMRRTLKLCFSPQHWRRSFSLPKAFETHKTSTPSAYGVAIRWPIIFPMLGLWPLAILSKHLRNLALSWINWRRRMKTIFL